MGGPLNGGPPPPPLPEKLGVPEGLMKYSLVYIAYRYGARDYNRMTQFSYILLLVGLEK